MQWIRQNELEINKLAKYINTCDRDGYRVHSSFAVIFDSIIQLIFDSV